MDEEQARRQIWLVDSQGLIYDGRGPMAEHKKFFSRDDYSGPPITRLVDVIQYVKPTALLGLSTQPVRPLASKAYRSSSLMLPVGNIFTRGHRTHELLKPTPNSLPFEQPFAFVRM